MTDHRRARTLTTEVGETILAHVAAGKSIAQAAAVADRHPQTVRNWIKDGNQEATRLELLGVDPAEIDAHDPRIDPNVRRQFAFSRAVQLAQDLPGGDVIDTLYRAATEGVEEVTVQVASVRDAETGQMVEVSRHEVRRTKIDLASARFLAERLDERMHLATQVHLAGANGEPLQVAGFSEGQAEAFALFTRTLLQELLALAPARSRAKIEKAIPAVLDVAMRAIEPPREEEPTDA